MHIHFCACLLNLVHVLCSVHDCLGFHTFAPLHITRPKDERKNGKPNPNKILHDVRDIVWLKIDIKRNNKQTHLFGDNSREKTM